MKKRRNKRIARIKQSNTSGKSIQEKTPKKQSYFSKYFLFYYPEESSLKRNLLFSFNSVSIWLLTAYTISRFAFDFPDLKNIPKPILWIAGTGFCSAAGLTLSVGIQSLSRRYFLDIYYRKALFLIFTFARIISFSSITLILIYSIGITDLFTSLLNKLSILSENLINLITNSISIIVSIVTGIVSNGIYAFIKEKWDKYKKRRKNLK
ncbi:MAG TPA: hypothetical protein VF721_17865 [Pyrinomonadaceae bacterium]